MFVVQVSCLNWYARICYAHRVIKIENQCKKFELLWLWDSVGQGEAERVRERRREREGVCRQFKPSQAGRDESYGLWSHKKVLQEYLRISPPSCRHSVCMSLPVAARLCLRVAVRFVEVTCPLLVGSGSKQLGCCHSCTDLLRSYSSPRALSDPIVRCHIR